VCVCVFDSRLPAHISDIVSGKSPAATAGIVLGIVFVVVSVWVGKVLYARLEEELRLETNASPASATVNVDAGAIEFQKVDVPSATHALTSEPDK
jgi:hypothetical protein